MNTNIGYIFPESRSQILLCLLFELAPNFCACEMLYLLCIYWRGGEETREGKEQLFWGVLWGWGPSVDACLLLIHHRRSFSPQRAMHYLLSDKQTQSNSCLATVCVFVLTKVHFSRLWNNLTLDLWSIITNL